MILDFSIPKKIRSTEEHNKMHTSSAEVAGTYVPNMSEEDMRHWKAKHIKGDNERIEIRKTIGGSQLLIVVNKTPFHPPCPKYPETKYTDSAYHVNLAKYKEKQKIWYKRHNDVQISSNGKLDLTFDEWEEIIKAIIEARFRLGLNEGKYNKMY